MEKLSSFERVIGNIPETEKEQILRAAGERFDDQIFEDLKDKERAKTPEELEMLSLANHLTNEIRQQYGLDNFNLSPQHIHVITKEAWPEKNTAFFSSRLQSVALQEKSSNLGFMKTVFHEMLHFKGYNAGQITTGESPEFKEYRLGLTVRTRDGKEMYFRNLNEAVVEEITKRCITKILDNPLFAEETKQTREVMNTHPHALTKSGEPLFEEDTFYAKIHPSNRGEISTETFTYKQERQILNLLIDKVFARNSDKFQNREEVFEVFAKGMITGNILPVGKLVDETFSPGTLRQIGELDQNIQAQKEFIVRL